MAHNIRELLTNKGCTFAGIDFETTPTLKGGKKNPYQGKVTKVTKGASVMFFSNSNSNAYESMVQRRLIAEGIDTEFKVSPRKWGKRIPDTCFVEHIKDDVKKYYVECIFTSPGKSTYLLDGEEVDPATIVGLETDNKTPKEDGAVPQGGLTNMVQLRTIAVENIVGLRVNHESLTGEFVYQD